VARNDGTLAINAGASDTNVNLNVYLGCYNYNGTPFAYSADDVAWFAIGSELTNVQRTAEYNAVVAFLTSWGSNV
jgi:hypothetical protein